MFMNDQIISMISAVHTELPREEMNIFIINDGFLSSILVDDKKKTLSVYFTGIEKLTRKQPKKLVMLFRK